LVCQPGTWLIAALTAFQYYGSSEVRIESVIPATFAGKVQRLVWLVVYFVVVQ